MVLRSIFIRIPLLRLLLLSSAALAQDFKNEIETAIARQGELSFQTFPAPESPCFPGQKPYRLPFYTLTRYSAALLRRSTGRKLKRRWGRASLLREVASLVAPFGCLLIGSVSIQPAPASKERPITLPLTSSRAG